MHQSNHICVRKHCFGAFTSDPHCSVQYWPAPWLAGGPRGVLSGCSLSASSHLESRATQVTSSWFQETEKQQPPLHFEPVCTESACHLGARPTYFRQATKYTLFIYFSNRLQQTSTQSLLWRCRRRRLGGAKQLPNLGVCRRSRRRLPRVHCDRRAGDGGRGGRAECTVGEMRQESDVNNITLRRPLSTFCLGKQ